MKKKSLLHDAASSMGKKGGAKTLERYGREHFRKITKGRPKGSKNKPKIGT